MLNLEEKKAIVAEVAEIVASTTSVIAAEYRGITVDKLTELRKQARESDVVIRVIKNSLAKRAFEGTDYACLQDSLKGPLMLAFSQEDPAAAARILNDFVKENDKLVVKSIALGDKLMDASQLSALAKMPTRARPSPWHARRCYTGANQQVRSYCCRTNQQVGSCIGCSWRIETSCLKTLESIHTMWLAKI